jgi:hypothetical protein
VSPPFIYFTIPEGNWVGYVGIVRGFCPFRLSLRGAGPVLVASTAFFKRVMAVIILKHFESCRR